MKALVTGATGFIGGALAERLIAQGTRVRVLARDPEPATGLRDAGAEIITGDVTDRGSCAGAAGGMDAVFHCAGVLGGWGIPDSLLWKVNFEGTRNMLEAGRNAGVKRFMHVSSCGIFGPLREGETAGDDRPYNPTNAYEKAKAEAEKLALSYAKEGMPVVVVRPEFVYGPGDMHLLPLFQSIRQGRFVFFGGGRSMLHPTYIDDVVDALLLAAGNERACGKAFNIAGERPVAVKEFIGCMARAMGVPAPALSVPVPFATAAGFLLDHTWGLLAKPPLTLAQARYLSENRAFTCKGAADVLGYSPKVGLAEGMKRSVAWYRGKGLLK